MIDSNIRDKRCVRLGLVGARKMAGYSQKRLADEVGISRSQLASMEIGIRNANDKTWKKLKKVLKVRSVEELWERFSYTDGWFIGDDGSKIRDVIKK